MSSESLNILKFLKVTIIPGVILWLTGQCCYHISFISTFQLPSNETCNKAKCGQNRFATEPALEVLYVWFNKNISSPPL